MKIIPFVKIPCGLAAGFFIGVVVWSVLSELGKGQHAEKIPHYKAGMRFTDVISDKMARLLDFIDSHKFTEDHRLNIRFIIKSPDKAILDGPHNYDVRKISMGGMLIETDLPFEVEGRFPMEIFLEGDKSIKFLGRVVHCLEITDTVPKHYDIGIEFLEMSEEDKKRLEGFVKSL